MEIVQTEIIEIEPGFVFTQETTVIIPGITLEVYREVGQRDEAALVINGTAICFAWTVEAQRLFTI